MALYADRITVAVETEVRAIIEEMVAPVLRDLETARAEVTELGADLDAMTNRHNELALKATRLEQENRDLLARIAELEASQPQPPRRPWLFTAETAPQPGDPAGTDGYVVAYRRADAELAKRGAALGGFHAFSSTTTPTSFGTAGSNAVLLRLPEAIPVINIKTPGRLELVTTGIYDQAFRAFLDSWHATRPDQDGYLAFEHEPDNPKKGFDPAVYRAAWVHVARLFLAHPISRRKNLVHVLMGWTFEKASGRDPRAWDATLGLTPPERKQVLFGADIYFNASSDADAAFDAKAMPFFRYAEAAGMGTAIFETALNNDARVDPELLGSRMRRIGERYAQVPAAVVPKMISLYVHQGPAAGDYPWLDTPQEFDAIAAAWA